MCFPSFRLLWHVMSIHHSCQCGFLGSVPVIWVGPGCLPASLNHADVPSCRRLWSWMRGWPCLAVGMGMANRGHTSKSLWSKFVFQLLAIFYVVCSIWLYIRRINTFQYDKGYYTFRRSWMMEKCVTLSNFFVIYLNV